MCILVKLSVLVVVKIVKSVQIVQQVICGAAIDNMTSPKPGTQ